MVLFSDHNAAAEDELVGVSGSIELVLKGDDLPPTAFHQHKCKERELA